MSITIPGTGKHRAPKHAPTAPRDDEVSIADVLRVVPEQPIEARAPRFIPKELAVTGAQPALAAPVADERSVLERVAADLKGLDPGALAVAQAEGITYAAAVAERQAFPQSVPGYCEGIVRGLLIAALWNAARWYRDLEGMECGHCEPGGTWVCEDHIRYIAQAMAYEELHDFATMALTDAAALDRVTGACRAGTADVCDLGSPGSPLALILEKALAGDGER